MEGSVDVKLWLLNTVRMSKSNLWDTSSQMIITEKKTAITGEITEDDAHAGRQQLTFQNKLVSGDQLTTKTHLS